MLKVNFSEIAGNTATIKQVSETAKTHAIELASGVINALKGIKLLNTDESELLTFVESVNPNLDCKFAGCSDSDKAATMFSHKAVIGEKVIYSVNTYPTNLADILSNLASTKTLFNAVKVETAKSDKAAKTLTFKSFIDAKKLPESVLNIAGVKEGLITDWFNTLRAMQVSEGAIRNLCKQSEITYTQPK